MPTLLTLGALVAILLGIEAGIAAWTGRRRRLWMMLRAILTVPFALLAIGLDMLFGGMALFALIALWWAWAIFTVVAVTLGLAFPMDLLYLGCSVLTFGLTAQKIGPWVMRFGEPPLAALQLARGETMSPPPEPPGPPPPGSMFQQLGLQVGDVLTFRPAGEAPWRAEVIGPWLLRFEGQVAPMEVVTLACLYRLGRKRRRADSLKHWVFEDETLALRESLRQPGPD